MTLPRRIQNVLGKTKTPFYLYDLQAIADRFAKLKAALPEDFVILYSAKANPHPSILSALREKGAWIDVASLGELKTAQEAGFKSECISFVGPGKSPEELAAIVNARLFSCVVESIEELIQLEELAKRSGVRPRAFVRLKPRAERVSRPSQFGIDEEDLPEVVKAVHALRCVDVRGLHFFTRSMFLNFEEMLQAFAEALAATARFEAALDRPMESVNLGGGFGIPYFAGQTELDMNGLKAGLERLMSLQRISRRYLVESGRYIAGPGGLFVTKILYKKKSRGRTYLVCDGGMSQNLAAIGVGQALRQNFPLSVWHHDGRSEREVEIVTVTGPSCYSIDVLGLEVELPKASPGDLICIEQMGAYGYTFSPLRFLTQIDPKEVVINPEISTS